MFSDIYKGAYFFTQGLKLACSRQYRGFLLSILLVTLFVFTVLLLFVAIPVVEAIGFQAEQKLPRWLHWLWYPAEVILYLVSIFLSGALSNIISTTLNSFRLAKLSLLVGASQPPSGSLQNGEIRDENTSLISSAKREASRLSYVLPAFFGGHLISDSSRQLYSGPIVFDYQRTKYRCSVLRRSFRKC